MGNEYVVIDSCFCSYQLPTFFIYLYVGAGRSPIQFSFISNYQSDAGKGISFFYSLPPLSSTKIFSQTDRRA